MYFKRLIATDIEKHLFQGKIIVIYGPRRTGKTTLAQNILEKFKTKKKTVFLLGDNLSVQQNLGTQDAIKLKNYLGDAELVVIDEAQNIKNIGINLKILIDTYPKLQIIATGSSSFDLANEIQEPLTGRTWEYFLPPLTLKELGQTYTRPELTSILDLLLKFGFYPEVVIDTGQDKQRRLEEITHDYLFKDILAFEGQKNAEFVFKLLQLLAFQIGNEVSYNELANILDVSKTLVEKYIGLLEQTFVIFRLVPLSRNLRNEVGKKRKIYFWDVGIRNALIQNFNDINLRSDQGALWENFCIAERMKALKVRHLYRSSYYWRTYTQKELDYIEEYNGRTDAYEIKWGKAKLRKYKEFTSNYPQSSIQLINRDNFFDFVGLDL